MAITNKLQVKFNYEKIDESYDFYVVNCCDNIKIIGFINSCVIKLNLESIGDSHIIFPPIFS